MGSLKKIFIRKNGFGIVEVLVSAAVLGFFCIALNRLQLGNHDAFLRIRGRDGAIEVAQQVMDSLKAVGAAAIPSDATTEKIIALESRSRHWKRGLGGEVSITYMDTLTVFPTQDYVVESSSNYATVEHVYAKQVNVKVSWRFKGSIQSINVSGVIR